MIQEIGKYCGYTFRNEYRNQEPRETDFIMFVQGRTVLIKKDAPELTYLTFMEAKRFCIKDKLKYLFSLINEESKEEHSFYLGDSDWLPEKIFKEYSFENHNVFREAKPMCRAFAGVTASQLANWYKSTTYCGTCGAKLVHDEKERMMRCPKCNAMHYPKICPAVIVAVTNGEKLLLTKYAGRDYKKYALIAGYTEIGETVEQTVSREVMEEVGLKVKNIKYYKSQPWSFSDTLLMGFTCELDGDDTIKLDQNELALGEWVKREDINVEFDNISLTNEMIVEFKKGNI